MADSRAMNAREASAVIFLLSAGLIACQSVERDERRWLIEDGKAVAQQHCAQCHAIGASDISSYPDAPPFRDIGKRYRFPVLEEEFINGLAVGHKPMPVFHLPPRGVDALLAYMRHMQTDEQVSTAQ